MKGRGLLARARIAAALLGVGIVCTCAIAAPESQPIQAAPEAVGFSAERLAAMDPYFTKQIATGRLPGVSVLLMRHGKVVFEKAYGRANADTDKPLALDNIFRIYSQTKPVTGVALMILFEQGKWHFDDPVTKFIPEFEHLRVFKGVGADGTIETEPLSRPPTMRELVTH